MHQNDAFYLYLELDYLRQMATKEILKCMRVYFKREKHNIKLRYIPAQLNYQLGRDKSYLPFVNKNIALKIN